VHDRSIRSLARLQDSGATSRVLNLIRVEQQHGQTDEHRSRPLFRNPQLNKAIYVKHRLRDNERELFSEYRTNATKIILPIDRKDLKSGGRSAFIGQKGYEAILGQLIGDLTLAGLADKKTLEALDQIPSFDPFLLREHLRRFGISPAACYFDLSEGDLRRMVGFLQDELRGLVKLAGAHENQFAASTAVLVQKILSTVANDDMEPLRLTLQLGQDEFMEGLFCWKGFLYYKWKLDEFSRAVPLLLDSIGQVRALDPAEPEVKVYIALARGRIQEAVRSQNRSLRETLQIYDTAYAQLTDHGQPQAFRKFLLDAPRLFISLGEKLGVLDHMASFWALRLEHQRAVHGVSSLPAGIPATELADIFVDFETGLGMSAQPKVAKRPQQYLVG